MTPNTYLSNGEASQTSKIKRLVQLGSATFLPAGLLLAVAYAVHPAGPYPPEVIASNFWVAIHVGFLLSLIFGVFGSFAALAVYLSKSTSRVLGTVGACLSVVGLFLNGGLDYAEAFIFPTLAVEFPTVIEAYGSGETMPSVAFAFPAAGIFTVVGYFILSFELQRTRCVPKWSGLLTMIGVIIFGIGLSGFVSITVAQIGAVFLGLGLTSLGWGLLSQQSGNP